MPKAPYFALSTQDLLKGGGGFNDTTTLPTKHSPTLDAHAHQRPCSWVLGGHGCDIIGHGWAWVPYYNGWAWVSMGKQSILKGSLTELSFNAFEGKRHNPLVCLLSV